MNQIKKSKQITEIMYQDLDTLGFIMRYISVVLAIIWTLALAGISFLVYKTGNYDYLATGIIPAILLVIAVRNLWKYRVFKPKDMLSYEEIEEKIKRVD